MSLTASDVRTYPLSPAQERLNFIHDFSGANGAYLFPINLRFRGALDADLLVTALRDVVLRHEVLRSRVDAIGDLVVQVVDPVAWALEVTDLSHHAPDRALEIAEEASAAEAETPFDLRARWMRARLLRLGAQDHVLLVSVHHIAFDGWSCQIFLRELAECYNARATGRLPELDELPTTYGDIAGWEAERAVRGADDAASRFWAEQTADLPGDLPLPTDRPRSPIPSGRTARIWWHVGAAETHAVEANARRYKVTPYMLFLAVFEATLAKAASRTDFFVGGATAGRRHPDSRSVVGLFVNDVGYRSDVRDGQTLGELVAAVKRRALSVYRHQDLPFEQVVAIARPPRQIDRHPLFQHAVVLQPREGDDLHVAFDGLELAAFTTQAEGSALELTFSFHYEADGLHLAVDFVTDLWEEPTIVVLLENFWTILRALRGSHERRLDDLDLTPVPGTGFEPAERTAVPEPERQGIGDAHHDVGEIVRAFADLLNVEVSADTDFFAAGGDSILAMRAVSRLRSAGLTLGVRDVFRGGTPRRLASLLNERAPATGSEPLPPTYVRPEGAMPPLPMHAWFDHSRPRPAFYNFSALLRYDGAVDPRLLTRAVAVVLKRHDATRMRFGATEDGLVVRHAPGVGHERLEVVDLRDRSDPDASARLHEHAAAVQASLEIMGGRCPIRVVLYQCPGAVSRLLVAACHLVMDVVSMHVVVEEIQESYSALVEGRSIDLPPRTASSQAWSEALLRWAQSPAADERMTAWSIVEECAPCDLPVDHPDASNVVADEQSVFFLLSPEESASMSTFVATTPGVTYESLILAATGTALGDLIGDRGILVDLENHGRVSDVVDLDVSRTVGWLTSIFPFPLPTGREASGRRGVMRVTGLLAERDAGVEYSALAAAGRGAFVERSVAFSHAGAISSPADAVWHYENLGPQDARDPAMRRRHRLEVDSLVVDGILRFSLTFSSAQFDRASIDALGRVVLDALMEVADVAH